MTPKIERSSTSVKRKTRWIITTIALIATVGGYFYYFRVTAASTQTTGSQTQTEIVRPGNLIVSASGAGISSVVTISDLNQPYLMNDSLDETDWNKANVGFTANVTLQ